MAACGPNQFVQTNQKDAEKEVQDDNHDESMYECGRCGTPHTLGARITMESAIASENCNRKSEEKTLEYSAE